jgi:predicted XRE-type DNA-binding protein
MNIEDGPVYGSGNVFADLGVPNPELALAKANLAIEIIQIIRKRGLTQTQAAEIMGIQQPRVSNIVRGRLNEISLESLMDYLALLGSTIQISIISPALSDEDEVAKSSFVYREPALATRHSIRERED